MGQTRDRLGREGRHGVDPGQPGTRLGKGGTELGHTMDKLG